MLGAKGGARSVRTKQEHGNALRSARIPKIQSFFIRRKTEKYVLLDTWLATMYSLMSS